MSLFSNDAASGSSSMMATIAELSTYTASIVPVFVYEFHSFFETAFFSVSAHLFYDRLNPTFIFFKITLLTLTGLADSNPDRFGYA